MLEYKDIVKSLFCLREENKGITIIKSKNEEKYISYGQLWDAGSLICEHLKKIGALKNNEVIIQCKNIEYYMYAFWACAIGGFIAVPIDVSGNDYMTVSNKKIIELMNSPFLLHDDANNKNADADIFIDRSINLSAFDFFSEIKIDSSYDDSSFNRDDIMYVQFSSGSTDEPKGSALRRYNISANPQGVIKRHRIDLSDTIISWQPLTHCYGLTVFHILPIMLGVNQYLIPTEVFLKSPLLWLEKVNQYRITRIGTIPFALRHFMNYYQKSTVPDHWDLSCIKSMIIGAEQVKPELCNSFTALMARHNLNANIVKPAYGLTEATTIVSTCGMDQEITGHNLICKDLGIGQNVAEKDGSSAQDTVSYIELGESIDSVEMRIMDDDGRALPENTIGYLHIKGESVTMGYYKNPRETAKILTGDGWLDTGDIGFITNKNLVLIGRKKELIVVNGLKYLCNDLEDIINTRISNNPFGQIVVCNGLNKEKNTEQAVVFVEAQLEYYNMKNVNEFLSLSRNIKEIVFEATELMIDSVLPIDKIPRTFSGKLKRKELSDRFNGGEFKEVLDKIQESIKSASFSSDKSDSLSKTQVLTTVLEIIDKMFGFDISDYDLAFQDYGIVSIDIPYFIDEINKVFGLDIGVSAFFSYPNVNQLSKLIYELYKNNNEGRTEKSAENVINAETDKVAIIGMSCRFPGGANSIDEFWELLMTQKDGISDVPETRWDLEKYYDVDENASGKMYCKNGGFLNVPVDEFDARFFNITPKEAISMDPQQRLLLELTWEAFENAGMDITKYKGTDTGVYLGMSTNEYMMSHLNSGDLSRIDAYSLTGTCGSTACGRISYTFGFEGPSIAVDTACSSALTALHMAHQGVKNNEARIAVVGGVNLMLSPAVNVGFSKLHATSPDGHSKAFDASADGYGRSEGAGVLIIKNLSDAIRDNNNILGVIRSTSINQDGRSNGLTAPNGAAQEKLISESLLRAGLSASDVDYIEMHGTGTKLGDPIEVNAVANIYGKDRSPDNPLRIGSVKSNIGHLEAGAGIASAIKVLLSFKNDIIPSNLFFNEPNPFIDWDKMNVKVVDKHSEWTNKNGIRRAGINGFGFGGSNAHVILEEYIDAKQPKTAEINRVMNYILKISARSDYSLRRLAEEYLKLISESDESSLLDIIYSAGRGRANFECRIAVAGSSKAEIFDKLEAYLSGEKTEGLYYSDDSNNIFLKERKPIFMFTGQGSQYVNMGRTLYESNSVFKSALDECDRLFKPYILASVVDLIYGERANAETIEKTSYAQPLIFSIEYSLFKLWEHYGVRPEIVMGHSIGEYVAAVVSGIISLEDAVKLVSIRGRLMDMAPGSGAMGTIFAERSAVEDMLKNFEGSVSIAACNSKETFVISGEKPLVEQILNNAENAGYRVNRLKVSHAFHSPLMKPILEDFSALAKGIEYFNPKIRYISALYASEIDMNQVLGHEYWTEHILEKVDFYNAVMSISDPENYAFVEVGSHRVLSSLLKLIIDDENIVVGTLNRKKEDGIQFADSIAGLYAAGIDINWNNVCFINAEQWNKHILPNYQFERTSYWRDLLYDRPITYLPADGSSELLGQKIESPSFKGTIVFQSKFTAQYPFFIKEHIIFKTAISPAAAHVSMLLSAVSEIDAPNSCTLKSIELRAPLAVDIDEQRTVQVCLENIGDKDNASFSIVSKSLTFEDAEWLTHVQGKMSSSKEAMDYKDNLDVAALKDTEFDFGAGAAIYQTMEESGFELGESFRRIVKSCKLNGEYVYYIQPMDAVPNKEIYIMYPGVIDSILQTMFCNVLDEVRNSAGKKTIIPYFIGEIKYNYIQSSALWCRVSSELKDDIVYGKLEVFNESGEIIMKISDFMGKLTDRSTLLREMKKNFDSFYYHNEWLRSEDISKNIKANELTKHILISNNAPLTENICECLRKENADVATVSVCNESVCGYNIGDIGQKSDWSKLLNQIAKGNEDRKFKFIYHYEPEKDSFGIGGSKGNIDFLALRGILNLSQSIIESGLEGRSSVKILTRNVQNPGSSKDRMINLSQSLLWGYAKVFSIEHPNIFDGIIDFDDSSVNYLAEEIIDTEEYELCLRNGLRYISRMQRHKDYLKRNTANLEGIKILQDASYLITGGTGALGMVYAEYFVNMGAKSILLMCRRQPSEEVNKKIDDLRSLGVNINLVFADVGDRSSLETVLSSINEEVPAIRGVIHAAGILNDKMIADLEWEDFETVLSAKVVGLANLYSLLDIDELDFLIMLSSITSVLGNMGQANYAAANYFLNSFASYMALNNQKAYTFCWGPWLKGGMAAGSSAISENISKMGLTAITHDTGLKIIGEFFDRPFENLIIMDIDWDRYMNNLNAKSVNNYLSKIVDKSNSKKTTADNKQIATNTNIDILRTFPPEERKNVMLSELQKICGNIMGFGKGQKVDKNVAIKEQGADSLMIFSMRGTINKLFNVDLSVTDFFNYPTLSKLTDHLIDDLLFAGEAKEEPAVDESTEDLLSELEKFIN